jgi:hypothetical protein
LLFIPTTILDMTWGVRYLQEGHGFDYGSAVLRSAAVRLAGSSVVRYSVLLRSAGTPKASHRRWRAVLLVCVAWILYGPTDVLPPYALGLTAGVASGAAMIPYTVIKEVNPPQSVATATGVVNFLNFTFSALLGPIFGRLLAAASGAADTMALEHYQAAFRPLVFGVGLAIVLTLFLKETGPAVRSLAGAVREAV